VETKTTNPNINLPQNRLTNPNNKYKVRSQTSYYTQTVIIKQKGPRQKSLKKSDLVFAFSRGSRSRKKCIQEPRDGERRTVPFCYGLTLRDGRDTSLSLDLFHSWKYGRGFQQQVAPASLECNHSTFGLVVPGGPTYGFRSTTPGLKFSLRLNCPGDLPTLPTSA
jgi:hypothetical protein